MSTTIHTSTRSFTGTCSKDEVVKLTPTHRIQSGATNDVGSHTSDTNNLNTTGTGPTFHFARDTILGDIEQDGQGVSNGTAFAASGSGSDGQMDTTVDLDNAEIRRFPELKTSALGSDSTCSYTVTIREKNTDGIFHVTASAADTGSDIEDHFTDEFAEEVANFINGLMCRKTSRSQLPLQSIFLQLSIGNANPTTSVANDNIDLKNTANGYYPQT